MLNSLSSLRSFVLASVNWQCPERTAVRPSKDTSSEVASADKVNLNVDLGLTPAAPSRSFSTTLSGLVEQFREAWRPDREEFDFSDYKFDVNRFKTMLIEHANRFKKEDISSQIHFGYIEKFDLDPKQNPQIYMRADLHGDLKSLLDNIMTLRGLEILDENFRCFEGVHLVFLGDYCDRGKYGTEILELLMRLREENPNQVHLIRGNHEYSERHFSYAHKDLQLIGLVRDLESRQALESFYETMALTIYFSCDVASSREYIQCTHGLFEPNMDPSPLLDAQESTLYIAVPRPAPLLNVEDSGLYIAVHRPLTDGSRMVSRRVAQIQRDEKSPLYKAARRICDIMLEMRNQSSLEGAADIEYTVTAYNWGDLATTTSSEIGLLSKRAFKLSGHDIKSYLDLSSNKHKVTMLFRGHQHKLRHITRGGKALVTTLPVGMNSTYKDAFLGQLDRAYLITPGGQIANWKKRAILSNVYDGVIEVTGEYALSSIEI